MNKFFTLFVAAMAVAVALIVCRTRLDRMAQERDRYKGNTNALLADVEHYRVRDSLNAARVQSLELTVKEYERFRADDAALIKQLKQRNRDLAAVNKTQSQTIIDLRAVVGGNGQIQTILGFPLENPARTGPAIGCCKQKPAYGNNGNRTYRIGKMIIFVSQSFT